MKQSNLLHRRFDGLTDLEMDGIVEAAVSEWTIARSDRYDAEEAKEQAPSSTHSLDHYGI